MYYQEYLSNLCARRQWPEPSFACFQARDGTYYATARVNNREYMSESGHDSSSLARENAAMQAYWRCQNFSRNDGKHPQESGRGKASQGKPIAIGTERASVYSADDSQSPSSSSGANSSSDNSPTSQGAYHAQQSYYPPSSSSLSSSASLLGSDRYNTVQVGRSPAGRSGSRYHTTQYAQDTRHGAHYG